MSVHFHCNIPYFDLNFRRPNCVKYTPRLLIRNLIEQRYSIFYPAILEELKKFKLKFGMIEVYTEAIVKKIKNQILNQEKSLQEIL